MDDGGIVGVLEIGSSGCFELLFYKGLCLIGYLVIKGLLFSFLLFLRGFRGTGSCKNKHSEYEHDRFHKRIFCKYIKIYAGVAMILKIDAGAAVVFANKLEKMSRSALPVVVRQTLNGAAFDVKKTTMPESAKASFTQRKPSFFKAKSRVEAASGFDINSMAAKVGFIGQEQAVEDLEAQEHGGTIKGRAIIPLKQARISGNWGKNVRARDRVSANRGRIVAAREANGKNDAERYTKSAIHAGKGGLVQGTGKGAGVVFRINSLKRIGRNTVVNSTPVFSIKKGRAVKPKASHFMETASVKSARKMQDLFITNAKKKLEASLR
jgi:hypothetical protein